MGLVVGVGGMGGEGRIQGLGELGRLFSVLGILGEFEGLKRSCGSWRFLDCYGTWGAKGLGGLGGLLGGSECLRGLGELERLERHG